MESRLMRCQQWGELMEEDPEEVPMEKEHTDEVLTVREPMEEDPDEVLMEKHTDEVLIVGELTEEDPEQVPTDILMSSHTLSRGFLN